MRSLLLVAAGGAAGSVARYLLALALGGVSAAFPWSTLLVNVAGSFGLGVLLTAAPLAGSAPRLLLGVGVCGGFTTFSTLSAELAVLIERGEGARAALYASASLAVGLLAAVAGMAVGRAAAR